MAHLRGEEKTAYVRAMFSRVAPRYDLLNTVISLGMHHRWRAVAASLALEGLAPHSPRPLEEGVALDVATGTGDCALSLLRSGAAHVVGLDFLPSMLALAEAKARRKNLRSRLTLVVGDANHLPFPASTFQWVTSAFNMRNVADVPVALAEMARVARPGGRVVVLEIVPVKGRGLFSRLFRWYFGRMTPLLGQLLAGDREAYTYLPASVERFPDPAAFARMMEEAGLRSVSYRLLGLGSTAVHIGSKPL